MNEKNWPTVAYFSMEYGLHSDLKLYAGGLGILAGDYIKGAKGIGAPIAAIGIKWKQGYTDQRIDKDGRPYDTYHNYVYDFLEDTGVKVMRSDGANRRRSVQHDRGRAQAVAHLQWRGSTACRNGQQDVKGGCRPLGDHRHHQRHSYPDLGG